MSLSFGLAETRQRIKDLRAKGRSRYELPSMPAQFKEAKRELREDSDLVEPWVWKRIHDNDGLIDENQDPEEAK